MATTLTGKGRSRPSQGPATVIAVLVLMFAAVVFDVFTGVLSRLGLFGLEWAETDGTNIEIPQYTRYALTLGYWHTGMWILPRLVLSWALHRGFGAGRAIAIAVEALAIAAWTPVPFIWVDGAAGVVEFFDFAPLRVCALVCIAASTATIVLLCAPATRAWCARR